MGEREGVSLIQKNLGNRLFEMFGQKDFPIQKFEDEGSRKDAVQSIIDYKPQMIRGLVSPIVNMAHFVKDNNIKFPKIPIITYGETLTKDYRDLIQKNLSEKVFNQYGTSECRSVASECEHHMGLHVLESNIVEILKNGKEVNPGESGNLVITDLDNYVMPFIRYAVNDIATKGNEKCTCGREMPLIKDVEGRISEHIKTKDGKIFGLYYFTHFLGDEESKYIKQFKVIQKNYDKIEIAVVPKSDMDEKYKRYLESKMSKILKNSLSVEVYAVKDIPRKGNKNILVESKIPW